MVSSATVRVAFALIDLVMCVSRSMNNTVELRTINTIIQSMEPFQEVKTIAFFGGGADIEQFTRSAAGIPKVITSNEYAKSFAKTTRFDKSIFFLAFNRNNSMKPWRSLQRAFASFENHTWGVMVFSNHTSSLLKGKQLLNHFKWCWRNGFVNVLALIEGRSIEAFTYKPFPHLHTIQVNLTNASTTAIFPDKLINLHGSVIRSAVLFDPPRVFKTQKGLKGYASMLLLAWLKQHNGHLEELCISNQSNISIHSIIEQVNSGRLDISINPSALYDKVKLSYPIRMMRSCLLVPFSGEIAAYEYFVQPFESSTWYLCIACVFCFSFLHAFSVELISRGKIKFDLGAAFLYVLQLTLYLPPGTHNVDSVRNLYWSYVFFYVQLMLFGFILSNLYQATLTSLLAQIVFKTQLNTLSEVIARNLSIHTVDFEIPTILAGSTADNHFAELLLPRNSVSFFWDMARLEAKVYLAREDLIEFVLFEQQYLERPVFHLPSNGCLSTLPMGFMLPNSSPFEASINHFVLLADAAGLSARWLHGAAVDGVRAGLLHLVWVPQTAKNPLGMTHFQFAWLIMAGGVTLGLLVFLAEHLICAILCRK